MNLLLNHAMQSRGRRGRGGEYEQIDKTTLKRLKDIERLDPGTKTKVLDIIDTYLRDFKTRQAYGA